ncbi:unnamed protein product, partial [Rotaria magnacalcarata]
REDNYDEAIRFYQQALEIREIFDPSSHNDIVILLNNISDVYQQQLKYDDALACQKRALQIREIGDPSNRSHVANILNNIG